MSTAAETPATLHARVRSLLQAADNVILGKPDKIRLALACLLARGHLLLEDVPGVGKTTLAHTLARLLGLKLSRIQFTSDLLPADILGVSVFERQQGAFRFVPGPIFAPMVLADEINRATPRTQSALLEAMEERQVTAEGKTLPLPLPFFVMATQNPQHQIGTFALPESQLDRFLLRIELGYPDEKAERALLAAGDQRGLAANLPAMLSPVLIGQIQQVVDKVFVSEPLLDYVQALLTASRRSPLFVHGLSPRAGLALLAVARAWAWVSGRNSVLPDDIQFLLPAVACHRLQRSSGSGSGPARVEDVQALLRSVPLP